MPTGARLALIAEGAVSQSWVARLPGMTASLGPVMGLSLRNASRVVNLLRSGHAVDDWAEIEKCDLVLIAIPDDQIGEWTKRLLVSGMKLRNLSFVVCSNRQDSSVLLPLEEAGATIASLGEMEGFAGKRFLFEGDRVVLHRMRRLVESEGGGRLVVVDKQKRAVYEAGMTFATGMIFPMVSAAVDAMRAAGMQGKVAELAVETAVLSTVKSYLRAGKRGWSGPVAQAHREELGRQYIALFDVDEELAEMFLKIAVDYLAETASKPRNGADK